VESLITVKFISVKADDEKKAFYYFRKMCYTFWNM